MSIEDIQNSRFEKTGQDFKSRDREGMENSLRKALGSKWLGPEGFC
jgi:hypothetical protein